MSKDRQLQLDRTVILGIAEEKLNKNLEKVEKKIESHRDRFINTDIFSITRK